MASSSVLPTIHQLSERVSQLLQRSSQTETETGSVTLRCLELKGQIEQAKASVVEERMKQQVCKEEIARLKEMAAPRHSGGKEYIRNSVHSSLGLKSRPTVYSTIATPGTLVPRPRSKYVSTAQRSVTVRCLTPNAQISTMATIGDGQEDPSSPVSLRTKRNGMFFDEEASDGVAKRANTGLGSSRRQRVTSSP